MVLLAAITEEFSTRLELAREPTGWFRLLGLLLLVAAGWVIFYIYRREGRIGASARLRTFLACVRALVVLLLVLIWLDPVLATYIRRVATARVVVLVDDSASMALRDRPDSPSATDAEAPSRSSKVSALLNSAPGPAEHDRRNDPRATPSAAASPGNWLQRLANKNRLALYTFGERVQKPAASNQNPAVPPTTSPATVIPALAADQRRTDLGSALRAALSDAAGEPLAAVIVISDGQFNSGLRGDDLVEAAKSAHTAVHCIGVGAGREPPNVAVSDLAAPDVAARGDPLEMTAHVTSSGVDEAHVRVDLIEQPAANPTSTSITRGERVLATSVVDLSTAKPEVDVPFRITAQEAGEFVYTARLTPIADDSVETDNERAAPVLVLDEKLRLLVVAGRPSYEYRALLRLLLRDKSLETSCWLQSADTQAVRDGTTIITELPRKPEELFAYDVILLMDPNPVEFDSAWCITARRFVDDLGGGLLFMAGPAFSARFLRDSRLEDLLTLLPVAPDPDAELRVNERGSFQNVATPIRIPEEAVSHAVLRMGLSVEGARNAWSKLSGVWWYLPVQREKPLANVLIRAAPQTGAVGAGPVLLASQPFGSGRAVFMGFDGTWRWRTSAEPLYDRFWVQMIRFLGQSRRQGQSKRGVIVLDRESGHVGDAVKIEARVLDEAYLPIAATQIAAELRCGSNPAQSVPLSAIPGREGWFAGRAFLEAPGAATISIPIETSPAATQPAAPLTKHLMVRDSDVELRILRQNVELLQQISTATAGEYLPIDKAAGLPERIEDASRVTTPRQANPRALWDRAWLMLGVIGLLCVEWTLRRRNHLL